MLFKKIWAYLTFQKQETDGNVNLKLMHGINKITLFLFLICIIVMVVRCLR